MIDKSAWNSDQISYGHRLQRNENVVFEFVFIFTKLITLIFEPIVSIHLDHTYVVNFYAAFKLSSRPYPIAITVLLVRGS